MTVRAASLRERVVGTTFGRRHRPHLLEAWGQRFNVQRRPHLALFRYCDVPGMVGRVGTAFGEAGVNIVSAAVGQPPGDERDGGSRVMVVTTDAPVPPEVMDAIVASRGLRGRSVRRSL